MKNHPKIKQNLKPIFPGLFQGLFIIVIISDSYLLQLFYRWFDWKKTLRDAWQMLIGNKYCEVEIILEIGIRLLAISKLPQISTNKKEEGEKGWKRFENVWTKGCWYRQNEGEMFYTIGLRSRRSCQISTRSGDGFDAQSDWRNSRCRLSSLTDCRAVTRILSSHSEALRATSLWEGKERVDGSFQVSPSTGSAAKILRSEKVPSFSRTYSLCHRYIHIHIYVIVFRFHGDLYTWQAEHRRGSKARERRACSTREEIYFVYSIVWIGWFREFDSRPCWSPRTLERIETGVLPM